LRSSVSTHVPPQPRRDRYAARPRGLARARALHRDPANEVGEPDERGALELGILVQIVVGLPRLVADDEVVRLGLEHAVEGHEVREEDLVHVAPRLEDSEIVLAGLRFDVRRLAGQQAARRMDGLSARLQHARDRILREHALEMGLQPDFRVLNRAEQVIFFRDRLFEFPLVHYRPLSDPTRHIRALITLVSRCKDEDISPEEYLAHVEGLAGEVAAAPDYEEARERVAQQRELAATYAKYQELMARDGCVDFGDQIVLVLKLLRARANVRASLQRRFKYIMVDEFQDTNHAQFELVKLLGARYGNVACVCDDDQAIYRWRGAAITCCGSTASIPSTSPASAR